MMKRLIAIFTAFMLCITLIACSKQPPAESETEESKIISTDTVSIPEAETQEKTDAGTTTVQSESAKDNVTPSVETKTTEEKTVESEIPAPKKAESSSPTKSESVKPTEEVKEPTKEAEPEKIKTPSAKEVELKVIEYINQYRTAAGQSSAVILNGLNNVAKYRAKQLVNNYSHVHPRTTCTELKYGKYVDLTSYGLPETDNYYEGFDKEALCKGDWYGSADQIANAIATGFKNSSVHWEYVGQSKYQYMGVGVHYDESTETWYGCICMSKENYGG